MSDDVLPIIQSDWIARSYHTQQCKVARVRKSYRDSSDGLIYMDIVLYNNYGEAIGRESPAMGGPTRFEPAIPWDPDLWHRIEKPSFPLKEGWGFRDDPLRPGTKVAGWSIYADEFNPEGVKTKLLRIRHVQQDRSRSTRYHYVVPERPTNGTDVEVSALRRSAQELRDMARSDILATEAKDALKARANELEMEAMRLLNAA